MATSNRGEKDARFAIAATCFKCEKQIVKTEVYSKDNVHCGAPIAATIERHYATPPRRNLPGVLPLVRFALATTPERRRMGTIGNQKGDLFRADRT